MKKYAFMLLPLLATSLVGCNKSNSSESSALINKAKSLKYVENYSDKLNGLELADDNIYDLIYERFYNDAKTASYGETKAFPIRHHMHHRLLKDQEEGTPGYGGSL